LVGFLLRFAEREVAMRTLGLLLAFLAAPAFANPGDVRLKNTRWDFARFTPSVPGFTNKPSALEMGGSVDMDWLREMLGHRPIAGGKDAIRVMTEHPNARGHWSTMESQVQVVDVESATKQRGLMGPIDFNDPSIHRAPFRGFAWGLDREDRNAIHVVGVASRIEIKMADGSTTTIDLQDEHHNAHPLKAGNR
jgi:hypothetical protein